MQLFLKLCEKFLSMAVDPLQVICKTTQKVDFIPIVNELNELVDYASQLRFHHIPLAKPILDGNELEYVTDCINTDGFSQGKYVNLFEESSQSLLVAKYACVPNGTVALHLALVAQVLVQEMRLFFLI